MKIRYYYLIQIQYLGFRYHGWLKQAGLKTVESMVSKTLGFILGPGHYKLLGTSRTDSKVSANHSAFELFTNTSLDAESFLRELNLNLPNDIRALKITAVDKNFNIINTPEQRNIFICSPLEKNPIPSVRL